MRRVVPFEDEVDANDSEDDDFKMGERNSFMISSPM
jgi:hypothetical protein